MTLISHVIVNRLSYVKITLLYKTRSDYWFRLTRLPFAVNYVDYRLFTNLRFRTVSRILSFPLNYLNILCFAPLPVFDWNSCEMYLYSLSLKTFQLKDIFFHKYLRVFRECSLTLLLLFPIADTECYDYF